MASLHAKANPLTGATGTRRRGPVPTQLALHAGLLVLLLLTLYPVISLAFLGLKNPMQWVNQPWVPTFPLRVQNFSTAWTQINRYLFNTVLVGVSGCAGMLLLSSLSAFVFARMRFPGREVLYYAIISLLMVPTILSLIPAFVLYKNLHMLNTYWVLIIPIATGGSVFGVFLLRTFFASLPEELFEAARIDGCTVLGLYWRICIPLSLPILGTLAILNIVGTWNSFIWPVTTVQDDNLQVISVGLYRLTDTLTTATGDTTGAFGPLFAGYVIGAMPLLILFLVAGKYYVQGLVSSGLKL
jgi:ABC-type glycerol-3-phosphate transport system permease component